MFVTCAELALIELHGSESGCRCVKRSQACTFTSGVLLTNHVLNETNDTLLQAGVASSTETDEKNEQDCQCKIKKKLWRMSDEINAKM